MTKRRMIISSICFALFSTLSSAEVANPPAPAQLTAEQIIQKNVAARGGLKAWRSIQTMSMTGVMDAGRLRAKVPPFGTNNLQRVKLDANKSEQEGKIIQLPFAMELKRPLKMRVEVQFNGDTAVQVYNGTNGWKIRPFLGRREVESYTADEIKSASQQQQLDGYLIDYAAKGTKVASEGAELVDGKYAYKLKLTLKDGQVRHTWVDAQTFLDVKVDGTRRMDGKPRNVMTYMRDFKSVNGVMVPYTMETVVDGVKDAERIAIDKVSMNPQLADSRFTKLE
jgi:hypothetical protein